MRPRAVLFDFDYTLGDSSDGIIDCVNTALVAMGHQAAAPAAIRGTIGLPLERMFTLLTGADGPAPTEFRRRFVARADEVMVDHTWIFPGVREAVASIARSGAALGIVTTKYAYRVRAILEREGLAGAFTVIVGSDAVKAPKPDPEGLLAAVATLGAVPRDALYVGDSTSDAGAAANAGVPFVAVLSGVTPAPAFAAYPVVAMLPGVADLPAWLSGARALG